jgi:hypothetical protein
VQLSFDPDDIIIGPGDPEIEAHHRHQDVDELQLDIDWYLELGPGSKRYR